MSDAAKKSGLLKKALLGTAVLAVLLAGTVVAVPFLIDWDKVRKMAEEKGSEALGREVRIKALKVSLLSGIQVEGFRIGPARDTDQEPLVQAERLTARYRLLPLLRFKVVIHSLELDQPRLRVDRDRKGVFSFADLMKTAPSKPAAQEKTKPKALPVDVAVEVIRITGGSLKFLDRSAKPAMTVDLDGLDLLVNGFNLNGEDTRIKASTTVKLNGNAIPVSLDGRFGISLNRSLLSLANMTVSALGVKSVTSGTIKEFQVLPTMAISETVTVDLPAVWTGFKPFMDSGLQSRFTPSGSLVSRLEIAGILKNLKIKGVVTFDGVSLKMSDMPGVFESLEGDVIFDSDRISTSNLTFTTMENPIALKCDIQNLGLAKAAAFNLKKFSPRGKLVIDSPKIAVPEAFLPPLDAPRVAGGKGGQGKAPKSREMDLRGMIPPGVDLEGEIRIGKLTARKFTVSDINGTMRISGGAVSFKQSCALYGGKESATGKVLPSRFPFEYDVSVKADGVAVKDLMDDSMESFVTKQNEYKGLISGTAGMDIKVAGKGSALPGVRGRFVFDSPGITVPEAFLPPLDQPKVAGGTVAGGKGGSGKAPEPVEMDLRGMIPPGSNLEGEIRIGKLTARKFTVSDINGTVRITDEAVSFKQSCALYGGKESGTGKVLPSRFPFEYDVSVKADGVAVKDLMDDSMESFVTKQNEYKGLISGTAGMDIKVAGKGTALPGVRGRFVFDSPGITVPEAFLPPLDQPKATGGKDGSGKAPEPVEMDLRGMIPPGFDLEGEIRIGKLTARKFSVSEINGYVHITDEAVSFKESCGLYGGKESGTGKVLPSRFPLEYDVSVKADGVAVKDLMDDSVESFVMKKNEIKGRVSGTAGADVSVEGKGHTFPNLKKQLKGNGTFRIADGKVSKFDFFENGLGKTLKLDFLSKDIGFKSAGGSFTIAEGRFDTPDFVMDPGPDGDLGLAYKGWVDFDMNLKGSMTTRFHPRDADTVMKGDVGSALFYKDNGWAVGDWDVRGSMTMPILTPSKKQVVKKAQDEAKEQLKEKTPELKETGKKILDGLFKKKK